MSRRNDRVVSCAAALFGIWFAAGCTSAGRCKVKSEGCVPDNSGRCDPGLVRRGQVCVNPGTAGIGTTGGTGMTGGTGGMTGGTGGSPPAKECMADDLQGACARFCDAFCANETALCVASSCGMGECAPSGMLFDVCMKCDSVECAENLCMSELARTCEEFAYHADEMDESSPWVSGCFDNDPKCVIKGEDRCSDTCGTTRSDEADPNGQSLADNGVGHDLVKNGVCEDGGDDPLSDLCPRGSDCSDCGKRTCIAAGEKCTDHEDCCEYFGTGAFCVNVGTADAADNRCLLSCTETRTCPDAFDCRGVSDARDMVVGYVCAPK